MSARIIILDSLALVNWTTSNFWYCFHSFIYLFIFQMSSYHFKVKSENEFDVLWKLSSFQTHWSHKMAQCVYFVFTPASAVNLEGELFKDLMKGYNKNVRPMERSGDITQVDIKMTLTNLISLVTAVLTRANEPVTLRKSEIKICSHRTKRRRPWRQASG